MLPCTLRELAGYDPVQLLLVLVQAGIPLADLLRLGVPIATYLQPGAVGGDVVRLNLPASGMDLLLELRELPNRRYTRDGDQLRTDVYLQAWHNALKPRVRVQTLCGKRVQLRARGEPVARGGPTYRVRGFGMPSRSPAWGMPVTATRGDLFVKLHLRSVRASLVRAGALWGGIALMSRALLLSIRDDIDAARREISGDGVGYGTIGGGGAARAPPRRNAFDRALVRVPGLLGRVGKGFVSGWFW